MNFLNEEQVWCTHPWHVTIVTCSIYNIFIWLIPSILEPNITAIKLEHQTQAKWKLSNMSLWYNNAESSCSILKNIFFRLVDFQFWDYHPLQETTGDRKIINKQHLFDKHDLNKKKSSQYINIRLELNLMQSNVLECCGTSQFV